MNTPHDRAVRDLFNRAAGATEAERTCELAASYHHTPEVTREVEELLVFHDSVDTPLDAPALPSRPPTGGGGGGAHAARGQPPRGLSET